MKRFSQTLLLFACWLIVSVVHSQESDKPVSEKCEMLTARILVLDPDGHPLEGATVTQSGLRTKIEPGSHWGWDTEYHGPEPKVVTHADGIAEVPCPKYVQEKLETGQMTWSVNHPEFVTFREDRNVDDDPAEIRLERGFRIAVTAVHADTGEPILKELFASISAGGYADWKLHDNGMLVSPVFADTKCVLRVMQMAEGQPILFSDMIEVDPSGKSRVLLKDVKLSVGTRVEGRLADSVPRPIKNGHVTAMIVRKPASQVRFNHWSWADRAPINEDGTFLFESLPSNEVLQMIPVCDGWVPAKPTKESVLQFYPDQVDKLKSSYSLPQLCALSRETASPILEMDQATSVRVTVLDPDGKPLLNARVRMWPNQLWFNFGTQILGDAFCSRDRLLAVKANQLDRIEREFRYDVSTDDQGVATIHNLPVSASEGLAVEHDRYEIPIDAGQHWASVELKPEKVAEITIRMQVRGTEVLGATEVDASDPGEQADEGGKPDEGGGAK